jgi:8-oxo-dGTP pyrophosphatase MutT (NUDIX family)
MAKDKLFYIGVKALIENDKGEILLMHAGVTEWRVIKEPYWDFPGGRIQSYQSALQALEVEIKEETGITDIGNPRLITAIISNHDVSPTKGQEVGLALMIYKVVVPPDSKIVISSEHTEYAWVSKTEAAKRLTHKYPADFTDWLKN